VAETNPQQYKAIRFALVSPSDVPNERRLVNEVIKDINTHLAMPVGFVLELRQWEDVYPALHEAGPQGHIDTQLNIGDCDYVVGILWRRFGTPTPTGQTGTEHEVRQADALWQKHGRPQLMLYFNREAYSPSTDEEIAQWGKVLRFKKEFQQKGVVHDYMGADDFSKRFHNHLDRIIADCVNARRSQTAALQCSVSSLATVVRSEGISELIGEISLRFPTSLDAAPIACNIEVILNTNITNKIAPGNVLVGTFLTRQSGLSSYAVKARCVAANRVLFENVLIDLREPSRSNEYRVVGLRANALMIGVGLAGNEGKPRDFEPTLRAFVQVQRMTGESVDVVNAAVAVATIQSSSRFEIVGPVPDPLFSRKAGINVKFARSATVSPEVNLWMRFTEKYPGAFSTAAEESRYLIDNSQDAAVGIRFLVYFSLLPPNTNVYATTTDRESVHGLENAVLILANEGGDGSYERVSASAVSSDGLPIARVTVSDNKAYATWEWVRTQAGAEAPRSVTFGCVFAALPDEVLIGKTLVNGSVAPLSTIHMASPSATVPRFGAVAMPQVAFNVVWE
jgi:hypothetical protein